MKKGEDVRNSYEIHGFVLFSAVQTEQEEEVRLHEVQVVEQEQRVQISASERIKEEISEVKISQKVITKKSQGDGNAYHAESLRAHEA